MRGPPDLPPAEATPELFESGHLWLQELVVGAPLRFRLAESGRLALAGPDGRFEEPPPSLRHAVGHVRKRLDRDALLSAADDPSAVVFHGVATRNEGVPYDWSRLPGFLGTDVRSDERGLVPPDVVDRTFDRLGLTPVNAVAKEVQAAYFDPDDYDLPASAWYDGPAAGVVVRNKTGDRAVIRGDAREDPESLPGDPEDLAAAVVTSERVRWAVAEQGDSFDPVFDAVLAAASREAHGRLPDVDDRSFRGAVAERVRDHLDD